MGYEGTTINSSPTIALRAGADITAGSGLTVKYDTNGDVVLCNAAGEIALGILLLQGDGGIKTGDSLTVQIACRGKAVAGGTFKAGAALAVNASGKLVEAAEGQFVLGYALSAGTADGFVDIEIAKGFKPNTASQG